MNAHVAACGRLNMDPELRTTKAGKVRSTTRTAIAMPQPYGADEDADPPTLSLSITDFGQTAEMLACHVRGECLSIASPLEMCPYKSRGGELRGGWTCIANSVIGPRSSRPRGGGKSKSGNDGATARPAATPDPVHVPLDDPIGF